jgi:hypothetical protein
VTSALPYVDVERILVSWLSGQLSCRVLTDLPADLQDRVPLLQIARFGGGDIAPGLDVADLDVDAFGPDRGSAVALAEQARFALRFTLPGTQIDGAVFTRTETVEGPAFRPYANTGLRRYGATYRLYVHITG